MSTGHLLPGPASVALRAGVAQDARPCALRRPATIRPIIVAAIAPVPPSLQVPRAALSTGGIRQPVPIKAAIGPVGGPSISRPKAQNP
jgi:hypothetical protein